MQAPFWDHKEWLLFKAVSPKVSYRFPSLKSTHALAGVDANNFYFRIKKRKTDPSSTKIPTNTILSFIESKTFS